MQSLRGLVGLVLVALVAVQCVYAYGEWQSVSADDSLLPYVLRKISSSYAEANNEVVSSINVIDAKVQVVAGHKFHVKVALETSQGPKTLDVVAWYVSFVSLSSIDPSFNGTTLLLG